MTGRTGSQQGAGPFSGKTALITGGNRGLGRTTAEWLARDGARIVISARRMADVAQAVTELRAAGFDAEGIAADLSLPGEAHRLAIAAINHAGSLDLLVNNAGMSFRANFWDVSDAEWEYQVNVNYRSPFILAQHAARHMIEHGIRGRIVNISTIGVHRAHHDAAVYNSAKAAVEAMTRNMAFELGPYGITVNCVAPGAMMERPGQDPSDASMETASRVIPVGRPGRGEDIAAAVRFFCLPESEFTTGQTLLVDGGHAAPLYEK